MDKINLNNEINLNEIEWYGDTGPQQGDTGATGPRGPPGKQGDPGKKGKQGPAGDCVDLTDNKSICMLAESFKCLSNELIYNRETISICIANTYRDKIEKVNILRLEEINKLEENTNNYLNKLNTYNYQYFNNLKSLFSELLNSNMQTDMIDQFCSLAENHKMEMSNANVMYNNNSDMIKCEYNKLVSAIICSPFHPVAPCGPCAPSVYGPPVTPVCGPPVAPVCGPCGPQVVPVSRLPPLYELIPKVSQDAPPIIISSTCGPPCIEFQKQLCLVKETCIKLENEICCAEANLLKLNKDFDTQVNHIEKLKQEIQVGNIPPCNIYMVNEAINISENRVIVLSKDIEELQCIIDNLKLQLYRNRMDITKSQYNLDVCAKCTSCIK